jgi:3-deoxy-D-manno-octulosonic-acid transferase
MSRWRRNRRLGRPLFSRFNLVLAQNDAVSRAIKLLGAPRVITAGNLKIDAPPPPVDDAELARLKTAIGDRPVFLAASTHPGEDMIIAAAHALIVRELPSLLTIIVPRHPERGASLFAQLAAQGLKVDRRSLSALPGPETNIYIADTMGELGTFYSLAPVALIGGSLIEHGGQNPIEAVRLATAVLTGPHHHNFREAYDALFASEGAIEVKTADEISKAVIGLLTSDAGAKRMQLGAETALSKLGGALRMTLDALAPFLAKQRT